MSSLQSVLWCMIWNKISFNIFNIHVIGMIKLIVLEHTTVLKVFTAFTHGKRAPQPPSQWRLHYSSADHQSYRYICHSQEALTLVHLDFLFPL